MYKTVLLKLSGEALGSDKPLDSTKLNKIALEIKELYDLGIRIGIVTGGGNIIRGRLAEELKLERVKVDYIGMLGTVINCLGLRAALEAVGCKAVVQSALEMNDVCEKLDKEKAIEYLNNDYIVLFGAGTGKPYCSTDTAAAMRAEDINADVLLIAKNGVDGVYSADPNKDKNAIKYDILTYRDMKDKKLEVIDLTAVDICEKTKCESFVFDMNVPGNIKKAACLDAIGTRITFED